MELKFCPLFSGSSGNALYLGCGDTGLLIDAGLSARRVAAELRAIAVDPARLGGILVTHEHSDHIAGVGAMSRMFGLPIYAAEATWEAMEDKLGNIAARNRRTFEPGQDFYLGPLNVVPFRTPHDAADPVGFSFYAGGCKLSVATDIGCAKDSWIRQVEGSDLLLLEANHDVKMLEAGSYPYALKKRILSAHGHLSNDAAGAVAAGLVSRGVKAVILGHLSAENNFPELAYESVALALRQAGIAPGADVALTVAARSQRSALFTVNDHLSGIRAEVV